MVTNRHDLLQALSIYQTRYKEEKAFCTRFLELLRHERCYHRDHLPGHLTGSAFIVDDSRRYTLLTHHAKLNKWLQPGGHADGDENIVGVALREAQEETGITHFAFLTKNIFDVDIHLIPARKDFPEHFHYDVRFLLEASRDERLVITEESHDLDWVELEKVGSLVNHSPAMMRMVEKVGLLWADQEQAECNNHDPYLVTRHGRNNKDVQLHQYNKENKDNGYSF